MGVEQRYLAQPRRAIGSRQMLRPMAGAMMRSSAINRSNCGGCIDCAPSLSARSGIVVHLDDQPVGAGSDRRTRQLRDHVAAAGAVARVGHDRQVTQFLDDRDRGDVERVARRRLERPDAALAEDHVVVAAGQDVLRRQQPLFDRGGDAALEEHRLAHVAELAEQREVLHVPRADLEDVRVLG